jgi:haloalkane dehalogenase
MRVDFTPSPELFPFTSRWFDGPVGRVHYIDEGGGRPILFLHGNPTWSFLYRDIIRRLRDRFRCVAVDYPGFGLSDRPERYGYTPAEHADVVAALVGHLDLRDLIVMGQDWGGPIGMATALASPDRIRGLVFGNTWFWPTDRLVNKVFSWVMSTRRMQRAILEENYFVNRLIPAGTARALAPSVLEHYRAVQPSSAARQGVAEFPRQLRAASPWLARLADQAPAALGARPLLLVWGMRDFAFPPGAFLPRWKATFPDHQLVELRAAKHFIQEDEPALIADAIARRFGGPA